jgi:hypothetical protein
MVFADPVPKGRTSVTAIAARLFLSGYLIHIHCAHAASAVVTGRTPGLLED